MSSFEIDIEIKAPRARVWKILMDVERWPQWTPTVTHVQRLEPGPLTAGSNTHIVQPKLRPAVWQVTELNEDTGLFTWETRSVGVVVTAGHLLKDTPAGTRSTHSLRISGLAAPLVSLLLGSLSRQYVATEARALKAVCECLQSSQAAIRS